MPKVSSVLLNKYCDVQKFAPLIKCSERFYEPPFLLLNLFSKPHEHGNFPSICVVFTMNTGRDSHIDFLKFLEVSLGGVFSSFGGNYKCAQ